MAMKFSKENSGNELILVARNEEKLKQVAKECMANGVSNVQIIVADLGKEKECKRVVLESVEFDVLILNHIIGYFDNIVTKYIGSDNGQVILANTGNDNDGDACYPKIFGEIIKINYLSYVYLTLNSLSILNKRKGQIIVMSSMAGSSGLPLVAPYSASKHAVNGFFESLRYDLSLDKRFCDVSITICTLGNIDTSSNRAMTTGKLNEQSMFTKRHNVEDCSDTIVKMINSERRPNNLYYPFHEIYPAIILSKLFPSFFSYFIKSIYTSK